MSSADPRDRRPIRLAVLGCGGRMGRLLVEQALASREIVLIGGSERPGSPLVGVDLGTLAGHAPIGAVIEGDAVGVIARADAVVDFTGPEATRAHADLAAQAGAAAVVGTTGLAAADQDAIVRAARHVPVVQAANMSLGVTLLSALVEDVARRLGPDADIEIVEMHHRYKVDAPSGTALALGTAAARGRGVVLDAVADRGRDGHTGARAPGSIGFASLRGGDVVGDHTVVFAADGERLELTHRASSRAIFARGAIRAALWAVGRRPGLYGMRDVLGLEA